MEAINAMVGLPDNLAHDVIELVANLSFLEIQAIWTSYILLFYCCTER